MKNKNIKNHFLIIKNMNNYNNIRMGFSAIQRQKQMELDNSLWMNPSPKNNFSIFQDISKTQLFPYLNEV